MLVCWVLASHQNDRFKNSTSVTWVVSAESTALPGTKGLDAYLLMNEVKEELKAEELTSYKTIYQG